MLYRFDNYELDIDRHEFRADGELRVLEPQVFDLLKHLIANHDRTARKSADFQWSTRQALECAADF